MDFDPQPFDIQSAIFVWLVLCGIAAFLIAGFSLLLSLIYRGGAGLRMWAEEFGNFVSEIVSVSPRRVFALAQLTFREAIRRKALLVFVVFAVLFMFAGWFLSASTLAPEFQVKVYVSFVLRAISWLLLPVVLLLSCWGIPEDIKQRSLHTVVTKPARRLEVVLGRILGFAFVGTIVLVVMGGVGWGWIRRQLPETAQQQLTCRQPKFGSLTFLDRDGNPAQTGINVGDLWEFYSYIEGATKARAIWTFTGVSEQVLDDDNNLRLENGFQAFRSHKGDMRRSLYYQLVLVNPETGLRVPTSLKTVNEFRGSTDLLPRALPRVAEAATEKADGGPERKATYDLIDDLVSKKPVIDPETKQVLYPAGSLQVEVSCVDPGQYIGMARPHLFIRQNDRRFEVGYVKAIFGIEMMLLVVVVLGVTSSTFLKGPVSMMLTFCLIVIGQSAREFMTRLVFNQEQGGGALESSYRMIMHMNPTTELPPGIATTAMQIFDGSLLWLMRLFYTIIPDFSFFEHSMKYLANGFDVNVENAVLPGIFLAIGYFIPCVLLGCFCLRNRELEAK